MKGGMRLYWQKSVMSQKMAMQVSEESKICFVIERYRQKLLLWIKGQLRLDYASSEQKKFEN